MDHMTHKLKKTVDQRRKQMEINKTQFNKRVNEQKPHKSYTPEKVIKGDYQKEKKLRKRAQKELHKVQKKLDESKQNASNQRLKLREHEETIASLKHDNWKVKQQLSKLKNLKQELEKRDELIQLEKARRLEVEQMIQQISCNRKTNQHNGKKLIMLSNQVKQLKASNKSLRKRLENHDLLSRQKYGDIELETKKLRIELEAYRKRDKKIRKDPMYLVQYMKQHIKNEYLPDLLEMVEDFITMENLNYFYRGHDNLFYLFMRRVNLLNYHSKNRKNPYSIRNPKNTNEIKRLGFLTREKNVWKFVDVTKSAHPKTYPVTRNLSSENLVIDRPVRAFLHQDGVTITKCYCIETPAPTVQTKLKYKQTNPSNISLEYRWFGNFNVLVIGSRFMNNYKQRLMKHGCKVKLHNPFEESYDLLKGKISRAEIILVCERHVPHSTWDHVDRSQAYVSVLKQDSKDLISTYAYLTLKRCELI